MQIAPAIIFAKPPCQYENARNAIETVILQSGSDIDAEDAEKLRALQDGFNIALFRERLHDIAPLTLKIERKIFS